MKTDREIALAWVRIQKDWWAFDNVHDSVRDRPRRAWRLLDALTGLATTPMLVRDLGCGPPEDFVRLHAPAFIRQIELELVRDKVPDWDAYPFNIPAIAKLERLPFERPVTFLVGENGSGKSTLIETIAICAGFNPEGGTKNFGTALRPSESALHEFVRLARRGRRERGRFFLRAETMFNVSTEAEQYRIYGWEDLHAMSHGEAFLWIAMNKFVNNGLYILDEPEAALSPQRQLSLLVRIQQLVKGGAQFVISTHSPILLAYPDAAIFHLDRDGIHPVRYRDTEHYAVTKAFLENPERMLQRLFADSESDIEE